MLAGLFIYPLKIFKMSKKKKKVVEIDRLCICLESRINLQVSKEAMKKLTPKFYHKSGTELRLEQKLLITTITC